MKKRDKTKIFIDEIYPSPPKKKYPTNKIIYNHIDETRIIDRADMVDYKTSNIKAQRYIFANIDNFGKYSWATPLKKNLVKLSKTNFQIF